MRFKPGEKGFTLVELLVGLGIAVFVVGAASMTVTNMMRLSPQNNDWAVALRQVQDSGYWICRDIQMSANLTVDDNPATSDFLTIVKPEWDDGTSTLVNRTITYDLVEMPDGLHRLMRTNHTGEQIMIAQFLSIPTTPNYNSDNRTLTFTIEATSGEVTIARQYEAKQRLPAP